MYKVINALVLKNMLYYGKIIICFIPINDELICQEIEF